MAKIIHKKESCTNCGLCISICPEAFEFLENEGTNLKNSKETEKGVSESEVPLSCAEMAKEAASICPLEAIEVR